MLPGICVYRCGFELLRRKFVDLQHSRLQRRVLLCWRVITTCLLSGGHLQRTRRDNEQVRRRVYSDTRALLRARSSLFDPREMPCGQV